MAERVNVSMVEFMTVKCQHGGECQKVEEPLPKRDKMGYAMIVKAKFSTKRSAFVGF